MPRSTPPPEHWRSKGEEEPAHPHWRDGPVRPLIGLTADVAEPAEGALRTRSVLALTYVRSIVEAGGVPVILAPLPQLVHEYVRRCDAFVFTGGDDPRTEMFGVPTHPK